MSKVLELVMISVLLVSAFFFGVAYSGPVKENFSWLFETKAQEVEIPEIRKEQIITKTIEIEKEVVEPEIETEISNDIEISNETEQTHEIN